MSIPNYIASRIRRPAPVDCCVLEESTAVVSFGDSHPAKVTTLGLNPSQWEFRDKSGELIGKSRRLASRASLAGLSSDEAVTQTWKDCKTYFHRKPYDSYFPRVVVLISRRFPARVNFRSRWA